jgi:hypothetical protein
MSNRTEKNGGPASLLERLAPRAVGVASLLALLSLVVNYPALSAVAADEAGVEEEPVLVLLGD